MPGRHKISVVNIFMCMRVSQKPVSKTLIKVDSSVHGRHMSYDTSDTVKSRIASIVSQPDLLSY